MTLPIWTQSIHHDGSAVFVSNPLPALNETITIKLRTPADAPLSVVYFRAMLNGEFHYQAMTVSDHSTETVKYWECEVTVSQTYVNYMFMLGTEDGALYYSAQGMSFADYPDSDWFVLLADYDAPTWVRDEVYYQIFPERFHNGDPSNDVVDDEYERRGFPAIKREWGEKPYPWKKAGSMDFFGGDLQGITQKLDYLAELGITGIYTTPIFSAESNHKYDITDFFHVDTHFGGDEALVELRQASRERNMSIMLDITPNHCSYNHPWVTEFKNHPLDGDTSEFFYYDEEKDAFATWLGVPSLIKLNYGSQRLRDVMYRNEESAIRKWLQAPFSIDAWRLDVANMTGNQDSDQLDHEVWREMREYARQDNDEVYLLGEYFQDGTPHLQGDELDASMNYQGFNMPMRRWLVPSEKQVIETDNPHHYKPSIPAEVMASSSSPCKCGVPSCSKM
ncbi:MAG: alpha amylase N-terminal ig-like domain-containing protein, partial [Chloroflexota bacterium]